jgi:RNA polymerase sigma-70 factor (ECF subfamily)
MTGNDTDAADATQEALVAIVRGLPRFEGGSRFSTWAYRVTVNACLDELRRRQRRPRPGLDAVCSGDTAHTVSEPGGAERPRAEAAVPTEGAAIDDVVASRVDIDAALARITPELRSAVVLRDLCGLDYAEIADVLGIPAGTVRSRIARGRLALARLLEGNRDEAPPRPSQRR